MRSRKRPTRNDARRSGAVTVEMAVTLPILFLFFFAQFELVRLNNIRNSVYLAAYEGAREGLVPGATVSDIEGKVNNILSAVGAINATITVNPSTLDSTTERVAVTVSVPLDNNAWTLPTIAPGKVLAATVELARERDDTTFVP